MKVKTMKKFISFSKKTSWFQYFVNVSSVFALVMQCITTLKPNDFLIKLMPFTAVVVIVLSVICIIIDIVNQKKKNVFTRKVLVSYTQELMYNSRGKVVMFGGDLSWTEMYIETITYLTNNNQDVEIIFPLSKIKNAKKSVIMRFEKNIKQLKNAGAKIYCTENDYHLRCTLVDIGAERDNSVLKIISSKRIFTDINNQNKNKYKTYLFENSNPNDKIICESFYQNYELICKIYKEY